MAQTFFDRLRDYYVKVASVLRGEADAASVFANTTDIGISREKVYVEFLKQHTPSKCNVFLGGFIFDEDGAESKQLDIIITTDTAPRFDFHNKDGTGKALRQNKMTIYSCVLARACSSNRRESSPASYLLRPVLHRRP